MIIICNDNLTNDSGVKLFIIANYSMKIKELLKKEIDIGVFEK